MKRALFLITIFIVLGISSAAIFAQGASCMIEAGKGCGNLQIGMTRTEIRSLLGEKQADRHTGSLDYGNLGMIFSTKNSGDIVKAIVFVTNPKVWGDENFQAFNGNLPKNLSLQANPVQVLQIFGDPKFNETFGELTLIRYPGLEFGFRNNILMYIEANRQYMPSVANNNEDESSTDETNKQKELDSTPTPTPTSTSTSTVKPVSIKNGTLTDCKLALSEGCRNFLLYSNIAEVAPALQLVKQSSEKYTRGSNFTVYVEPTSGGIIEFRIHQDSGWKLANNLKFGEKMSKVKEKYPNGNYRNGRYYDDYLDYPNYTLGFEKGKLHRVIFERDRTDLERTAKQIRDAEIRRQEAEAEANKTPEQHAKEILAIYESFHERIEAEVKKHNKLAEEMKDPVVQSITSMYFSRKEEMSKIRIKIPKMIDDFLTKYAGQLSQAMIDHLNEDKARLDRQPDR